MRMYPEHRHTEGKRTRFGEQIARWLPVVEVWANEVHIGPYRRKWLRVTRRVLYVGPFMLARKPWGMWRHVNFGLFSVGMLK
jgi:hypothetical protein